MHHFECLTVGLGAFVAAQRMVNDGAVAVLDSGRTVAALAAHGSSFSREPAQVPQTRGVSPGLTPAEFVQPVVVDAEVMRDLVDDRDGDLVDDLSFGVAEIQQCSAVDGDGVR